MCHCVTGLYYNVPLCYRTVLQCATVLQDCTIQCATVLQDCTTMCHCVTGLYYDTQEILPCVSGDYHVNKANVMLSKFSGKEIEVRALIEGQFLAKRAYTEDLGFTLSKCDHFLICNKFVSNSNS